MSENNDVILSRKKKIKEFLSEIGNLTEQIKSPLILKNVEISLESLTMAIKKNETSYYNQNTTFDEFEPKNK